MAKKLAYEELEQRVKEFEKEAEKRKQADEALRESEERFRSLVEVSSDWIWEVNQNGIYTYADPKVKDFLGYEPEEVVGKPYNYFMTGDSKNRLASSFMDQTEKPRPFSRRNNIRLHKDGQQIMIETSGLPIFDIDGKLAGWRGIDTDISERKHAEEELKKHRNHLKELVAERTQNLQKVNEELRAEIFERKKVEDELRKSEEEYRMLLDSIPDPVAIIGGGFNLLSFNSTFTKLLGYNQHDLEKGLSPLDLAEDSEKRTVLKRMERRLAGREVTPESHTVDIRSKDGKTIPCEVKGTLIQSNGQPADLVIIRDIRERKQAEELIHNLSRQLLTAQESERQMIAYELHDSVAQDLSSSRIICEMLLKYKSLTPGARKQISEISGNLHKTLKSVRDLSYELRPPGLEDLGLAHTMYRFCEDFSEQTGIRVDFQSAGIGNLNLNYNTKINLYRLLQEGLNNVKRHADASNVKIRLIYAFPNVILRIYDDGKGFDLKERLAKTSREKRMGLSSMEERVALLLGRIDIESSPGKGTKVVIEIPHKDENIGA